MIFEFPRRFDPDACELRLPDVAAVRALGGERLRALDTVLATRRDELAPLIALHPDGGTVVARCEDAIRVAYGRLALRHGHWGEDFHAYHNEGHILEILDGRIGRLIHAHGVHALDLRDWCLLGLFAACHDLRQRETSQFAAGVGANERASLEEAERILDACGFSREDDADFYLGIDLTICGSTFDARPVPGEAAFNSADLVQSGGALAAKLEQKLDKHRPGWRDEPALVHAHRLALIAADLDTANVAEPFDRFGASAENLCREREMLSGRDLAARASAMPVLGFLTDGQNRFFFDLHRFSSELGRGAFEAAKDANALRLRTLSLGVRARIAVHGRPATGAQVIETYREALGSLP